MKDSTFHGLVIHLDGVVLLWAAVVEATQQHCVTFELQHWFIKLAAKNTMYTL